MNGRQVYRPAPAARWTLFGLPLTWRVAALALAQATAFAALWFVLVVCMSLGPQSGLN